MSRIELRDVEKLNNVILLFVNNVKKEPAERRESLERVNKFINDLKTLENKLEKKLLVQRPTSQMN